MTSRSRREPQGTRNAPAPAPSPPLEENEVFDLDNIGDGDEDDDYVDVPTAPGRRQPPRNARQAKGKAPASPQRGPTTPRRHAKPAAPTRRRRQPQSTATPDKLITPRVQSVVDKLPANSRVTALDIPFFFKRGDKNDRTATTDCMLCLDQIAKGKEPPSFQFRYRTITSNSGLRGHLRTKHAKIYRETCIKEGWDSYILANMSSTVPQDSIAEVPEFNKERLRDLLVRFIVRNDLSIRIIDSEELRAILRLCRPTINDGDIPGRTKMRDLILHQFQVGYAHLKDEIAASLGKISFTTDIWSSLNRTPYLALTGHWLAMPTEEENQIARKENRNVNVPYLKSALLAFHPVFGSHTGKNLAELVLQLVKRAGISDDKIGHFTTDSAANNLTMMEEMEKTLLDPERSPHLNFNHKHNRVPCFAHIVNICAQHTITSIEETQFDEIEKKLDIEDVDIINESVEYDDYAVAVSSGILARARALVTAIRASGQRKDAFRETIIDGNARGLFVESFYDDDGELKTRDTHVKVNELLKDVKTRWDSTYLMVQRLIELRGGIDYFLALPANKDLAMHRFSDTDWLALSDVCNILAVPSSVQQVMSHERTPVLSGAIMAIEMLMTQWERYAETDERAPILRFYIDVGMTWAKTYYTRMDDCPAYVIAMFLNPSCRISWIQQNWDPKFLAIAEATIKDKMAEYEPVGAPPPPPAPVVAQAGPSRDRRNRGSRNPATARPGAGPRGGQLRSLIDSMHGLNLISKPTESDDGPTIEQEYQSYITSRLSEQSTDIFLFWKNNESTHKRLYKMAMDYLPIQATSVPSERIFSSSGETDTKKRNRLTPAVMEALQVLKFMYKSETLNFTGGWASTEKSILNETREISTRDQLADVVAASSPESAERAMDIILAMDEDEVVQGEELEAIN